MQLILPARRCSIKWPGNVLKVNRIVAHWCEFMSCGNYFGSPRSKPVEICKSLAFGNNAGIAFSFSILTAVVS